MCAYVAKISCDSMHKQTSKRTAKSLFKPFSSMKSMGVCTPTTYGQGAPMFSLYKSMGVCTPTTYGQGSPQLESMGVCTPTTYGV